LKLKLDLHVHTSRSNDAVTLVTDIPTICRERTIDGVAITDHNMLATDLPGEILAIHGVEVSSRDGHVLGLGLNGVVQRGLSADATIREIHNNGGLVIVPHPYDWFRSSVKLHLLHERPDAIETINASSSFHWTPWRKARNYAERESLPSVAGSDSHIPDTIGTAYTQVEAETRDERSVLEALKRGLVSPRGQTIGISQRLRKRTMQAKKTAG
jgi:predicted metal-dependent phosphoesterase TrpH